MATRATYQINATTFYCHWDGYPTGWQTPNWQELTAGANKGFLDPFSPQTEAQRAYALSMLNQIHQQFITVVREGRGDRLKETPDMFSGLFWSGQQAVDMGLADAMGSLDSVAREVVKAPEVIDYSRHENVAERLAKRFGAAVGEGAVHALRMGSALR